MVRVEYFNGKGFIDCGEFNNERVAWISLGGDNYNYRVVDIDTGKVLKSNIKT